MCLIKPTAIELNYIFDMGSRNDKELALAVEYLPYLGTSKLTVDDVKRKFYDLGLTTLYTLVMTDFTLPLVALMNLYLKVPAFLKSY